MILQFYPLFVWPVDYIFKYHAFWGQVVYILDQVRALENEMLENLRLQGLDFKPQIVIVCFVNPLQ